MMGIKRLVLIGACAGASLALAATTSLADEVAAPEVVVAEEVVEAVVEPCPDCPVNNGNVSFAMGADITTAYFFRGILQEKNGFIAQPWAEVSFVLWEPSDDNSPITDVALTLGTWNSVQSEQTGSTPGTGPGNWYESDIYAGLSVSTEHGLSAGVTYVAYTYPGGSAGTVQEVDLDVSYDDSGLYSGQLADLGFSAQPYVLFAFEVDKSNFGTKRGDYMEIGAEPAVTLNNQSDYPVTVGVPLTVGLSLDNYYLPNNAPNGSNPGDDVFGYASIGLGAGVPLAFVPAALGSVSAGLNVEWLALGSNLQVVNEGQFSEWIGTASVSWEY